MELFGRSPTHPTTGLEWLVLAGLLGVIVLSVLRAADLPAALLTSGAALAAYIFDRSFAIPFAVAVAGLAAFVFRKRTVHREPEQRALREGTVFVAIVALYALGSQVVHESWEIAQQNSIAIIDFEQTLRIGHELALQRWLLDHDRYLPLIDTAYSWLFLPFVGGTLAWLYLTQDRLYRQYRTALAISALLAVIVVALHPVAPPRSTSGSGLIGTHALVGGSDGMIGPFDAVPSLHVGWAALSGMALYFGVRSRLRWVWLIAPPVAMLFMAMATGEHYLVDCVVGLVIALIPFLTIQWVDRRLGGPYYFSLSLLSPRTIGRALNAAAREIADDPRLRGTVYMLGLLLTYLLVREAVDSGFTEYWGYMVAQIALTILILVTLSVHFSEQGGFSLLTHAIVIVTTYADTFGTAGHLYDRFSSYDKITHFLGCAAVASAMGDLLINMSRKGTISWAPSKLLMVAVALALTGGIAWEIYEYVGDKLLDTGRHNGAEDTIYDLISDTVGAVTAASFLYWWHFMSSNEPASDRRQPAVVTTDDEMQRLDLHQR